MSEPKIENSGSIAKPVAETANLSIQFYQENDQLVKNILTFSRSVKHLEGEKSLYSGKKKMLMEGMIARDKNILDSRLDSLISKITTLAGRDVILNDEEADSFLAMREKMAPVSDQENFEKQSRALQKHNQMMEFLRKNLKLDPEIIELLDNRIMEKAAERKRKTEESKSKELFADQKDKGNLFEARKKLEGISNGEANYFDPEEELKEIRRKISAENFFPLSVDEKKKKLKSYKRELAEQKAGIAKINQRLEDYLLKDDNFDENKLLSIFEEEAKNHKLAPFQIKRYNLAFERIKERMRIINYYGKLFEGMLEEEKFERIFGFKPEGPVKVNKHRLCFSVFCKSPKDYANVYSAGAREEMRESLRKMADYSGGAANIYTVLPELRGGQSFL